MHHKRFRVFNLRYKHAIIQASISPFKNHKTRVPGLQAGQLTPSDDFDEPLPDDFWLGRER